MADGDCDLVVLVIGPEELGVLALLGEHWARPRPAPQANAMLERYEHEKQNGIKAGRAREGTCKGKRGIAGGGQTSHLPRRPNVERFACQDGIVEAIGRQLDGKDAF